MRKYIAASILSADFSDLAGQIHQAEDAGVDWIHVDVMDGHFVPNITMGPVFVETCRKITDLPLDVHLMITNPDFFIDDFAQAGADHLLVHFENNAHIHRTLQEIRGMGVKPGVVINPGTPAENLFPVLHMVDIILVMSVNPGFSGQAFIPEVLGKATLLRQTLDRVNPSVIVEMDGGLSLETIRAASDAGVDAFVSASSIFKHSQGIAAGVKSLQEALSA